MNLAPIWTICAQSPPPVCHKDHPYLKRSGATPGSKSGSRTVTGLVGGLRARSAVRCGDLEFGMAALAEPEGSLWRFTMGPGCVSPAVPSVLRPGCLGGQRDLGEIGVAGEEDQLVAVRIGEDGQ